MEYLPQGFYTEPFDEIRNYVRARYSAWRNLFLAVNGECVAAQRNIYVSDNSREILAAAYFSRTINSCQASALLLERGLPSHAQTLTRSALETLFSLAALTRKAEIADRIIENYEAGKTRVLDRMLRSMPELRDVTAAALTEAELTRIQSNTARELKVWDLAVAADMVKLYLSHYTILSVAAHNSVYDIQKCHFDIDANKQFKGLSNIPLIDDQDFSWATVIEVLIRAAEALNAYFSGAKIDVNAHQREFQKLFVTSKPQTEN